MKKKKFADFTKSVPVALITLLSIIIFVCADAPIVSGMIDKTIAELEGFKISNEGAEEQFSQIKNRYERRVKYINLTVSHSLTLEVEAFFSELQTEVKYGDENDIQKAKSRLIDALLHLKRLSGFKLESII